jgi:ABC-2 type transport system ATP-binding protein
MISIDNLNFSYKRRKPLFENLSLEIPSGNIIGLLGKNGAGKTTLLKLISGMIFPDAGTCKVFDKESKLRLPSVLSDLYFLPEEIYAPLLAIKNFVKLYSPFYPRFSLTDFNNYLSEFQISEDDHLRKMSYGQKKKALIAFALATNCSLLLMDEPTNGLDIPSKSQFRKIIASVTTEERSIIISTHQIRDLGLMIDPILILDNSRFLINASQETLQEKLMFTTTTGNIDDIDVLYKETIGGSTHAILPNIENQPSVLDIELLFNAAVNDNRLINYLNTPSHE